MGIDDVLSGALYFAVFAGVLFGMLRSAWAGAVLTIVPLLGDCIVKRTDKKAATVVRAMLLFQTLMLWIVLPWAVFDWSALDAEALAGPRVVNVIRNSASSLAAPAASAASAAASLTSSFRLPSLRTSSNSSVGQLLAWIPRPSKDPEALAARYRSQEEIYRVFGSLPPSNAPDLKFRSPSEVRSKHSRIFSEFPSAGFDESYRNPCWLHEPDQAYRDFAAREQSRRDGPKRQIKMDDVQSGPVLSCLPAAYLLGQPKCGTSDLFERMSRHDDISMPVRKEVRWLTRGEFTREPLPPQEMLGNHTSLYSFTSAFADATRAIRERHDKNRDQDQIITIDGGPNILWWPTQSPDGTELPEEIPPAQIIRELQPNAKFIIAVQDPVARMYSDYYFLDDSMYPLDVVNMRRRQQLQRGVDETSLPAPVPKSPEEFHKRTMAQINDFNLCVESKLKELGTDQWFRASQICAHDRSRFAVAGWGRISVGLYAVFFEKWLEHFSLDQFLVVRLEDYEIDPRAHMQRVFDFLGLREPRNWDAVLHGGVANRHRSDRSAMLPITEKALRDFYKPYNRLFAELLKDPKYLWEPDFIDIPPKPEVVQPQTSYQFDKKSVEAVDRQLPPATSTKNMDASPPPFSLDGLVLPSPGAKLTSYTAKVVNSRVAPRDDKEAALGLCIASFALDLYAVKLLLYDYKVPGHLKMNDEFHRGALHCLSVVAIHVDAHQKSHIFHMLKGDKGHLTDIFDPPLPIHVDSTVSNDLLRSLEPAVMAVAEWLLRAGADIDLPDDNGFTPLHYAAHSGFLPLVKLLLERGANPNARTSNELRTPLHLAAAMGHTAVLAVLMANGGNMDLEDFANTSPRKIASSPGPVRAEDAARFLNITQRDPIRIERPLFPQPYAPSASDGESRSTSPPGEASGSLGGYSTRRLQGYETDMSCGVDQFEAHQVTGKQIYYDYIAQNKPILIRGMLKDWPAVEAWRWGNMRKNFGHLSVHVSSIPYSKKFSGLGDIDMTLGEYMDAVSNGTMPGGEHPWYVFVGHPIAELKKEASSAASAANNNAKNLRGGNPDAPAPRHAFVNTHLVDYNNVPTPPELIEAFNLLTRGPSAAPQTSGAARSEFVNAQWAFGGRGTGAPVHFHNTAWNALIYGAKKWVIYPPSSLIMSNEQILQFIEQHQPQLEAQGIHALTCVQTAGDLMIIPESWSHGVLNIQDSVAVATEAAQSHWRPRPGFRAIFTHMPNTISPPKPPPQIAH